MASGGPYTFDATAVTDNFTHSPNLCVCVCIRLICTLLFPFISPPTNQLTLNSRTQRATERERERESTHDSGIRNCALYTIWHPEIYPSSWLLIVYGAVIKIYASTGLPKCSQIESFVCTHTQDICWCLHYHPYQRVPLQRPLCVHASGALQSAQICTPTLSMLACTLHIIIKYLFR